MYDNRIIRGIIIVSVVWSVQACSRISATDSSQATRVESRESPVLPVDVQDQVEASNQCVCPRARQVPEFATKAEIKEIQARLILLGYPAGEIDGVAGGTTRNAIKAYQLEHRLLTDGRPSTELLLHIRQVAGNGAIPDN